MEVETAEQISQCSDERRHPKFTPDIGDGGTEEFKRQLLTLHENMQHPINPQERLFRLLPGIRVCWESLDYSTFWLSGQSSQNTTNKHWKERDVNIRDHNNRKTTTWFNINREFENWPTSFRFNTKLKRAIVQMWTCVKWWAHLFHFY